MLSGTLLCSGARWGISLLEGAGSHRSRQAQARCTARHILPPALPSRAERHVPRLSPLPLGFLGQEPCEPGPRGRRPEACGVPGWGSQGGRMPVVGTEVGIADRLPGIFQAVGGSGHAKASYAPEPGLLPLRRKLPSVSAACRARRTMPQHTGQATCSSVPREQSKQIPGALVPSGKGGCHSPLPGQSCPMGLQWAGRSAGRRAGRRAGQRARTAGTDGSPASHPHLSHARTCSRARPRSRSMPPCCSSPLGRQECAPRPRRPGMPFKPWLHLLLLHGCCKVTPEGREQMVPCHRCHPGTAAWATLAHRPDPMVGKAAPPSFSCPDSSFPQPPCAAQRSPASLQFPRLARHRGEGGPQPRSRLRPEGGLLPAPFGGAAGPAVPGGGRAGQGCPLATQGRMGHGLPGLPRLPDLTQGSLGKESWHGLAGVGERVGTDLLSPPQSQAGPCLNHTPARTGEGAALPPQRRLPSAPPRPGKGATQSQGCSPWPTLGWARAWVWTSDLGATLALWADGRDLSARSAGVRGEERCHPASMAVAGLLYPVLPWELGPLALPGSPWRAVGDDPREGEDPTHSRSVSSRASLPCGIPPSIPAASKEHGEPGRDGPAGVGETPRDRLEKLNVGCPRPPALI